MNIATSYVDNFGVPRCGCPDFNTSSSKKSWAHHNLTYFIANRDTDLTKEIWDSTIKEAFDSWSKVADIQFKQIDREGSSNIVINIGAGKEYHFDGPNGTLAWAYLPPRPNYTGQLLMRFDTEELWSDGHDAGMLLKNVAAHEIGHILGLPHSSVKDALMAPYYSPEVFEPQKDDDIPRIQELYGKPSKGD